MRRKFVKAWSAVFCYLDLMILKNVPKGKRVIVGVPSWDTSSHVRHFKTLQEAKDRYKDSFDIKGIRVHELGEKKIYLLHGVR